MSSIITKASYISTGDTATSFQSFAGQTEGAQEKLALVIPTLREAGNIRSVLDHVRSLFDALTIPCEVLVVDDDSGDGTGEIVSSIALEDPRVRLLVRRGERGVAGATLFGWQNTSASILGVMDADFQHPPELLPDLISAILAGNDVAIGSRYAAGGSLGAWNPVRKLISAAALSAAWPIQRRQIRVKDPTSGFFLLRRECWENIRFQSYGFKLLLEILVRGHIRSVREIPFAFGPRYRGASKATAKVALDYGRLLARLYAIRLGLRND